MSARSEQPQKAPPKSPQKKPCKQPLAPELGNGAIAIDATAPAATPTVAPLLLLAVAHHVVSVPPERVIVPRPPPDPYGLIVVRTHFLLV